MRQSLFASIALALAAPAAASTVFDESIDGDLSTDPLAPTPVAFTIGSNVVSGSVVATADTRDYFTFTIAPGQSLTGIFLLDYTDLNTGGNGDRGFAHIDDGVTSVIPSSGTSGDFLGGSHLDRGLFPDAAANVLDRLGLALQGGVGFGAPLGPGDYTFNVQQTGPELTGYSLSFEVVPAPSTLGALAGFGLLGGLRRRR